MKRSRVSRRAFLRSSAVLAGAGVLASASPLSWGAATQPAVKRTAADQVPLGKTGITLSRLGIGTGTNNGHIQRDLGKDNFDRMIRHGFDRGLTYIDCAHTYVTFDWIADAIKGLPREKLFLQSKIWGRPTNILAEIDRHRTVYKTDYIDSLLIHCMTTPDWTDGWKGIMDGFNQAKEKKWIRARGVSCHTLPALQAATRSDWPEVHLVRVNPMGQFMDGQADGARGVPLDPVLAEIRSMHEKGRGVIGMKLIGNGTFTDPADRERSVRFAMINPNLDAVVIGMKNPAEVDEGIAMINRALAVA